MQTISNPVNTIKNALLIIGSDKRGAAYGVFELSQQLAVSPWYWWADVPAKKNTEVYIRKGAYNYGSPSAKYRGIFINDEAPAFSGWTKEKFDGNKEGKHTIKYWMVSSAVMLQKMVIDFGGLKPSYLDPQETIHNIKTTNE